MRKKIVSLLLGSLPLFAWCQSATLTEMISRARENNPAVPIAKQSLSTRENLYQSTKRNHLPKVDVLAGYNYLGEKTRLNLQGEKSNVVNYAAGELTGSVGQLYQQITGNTPPPALQQQFYTTSQNIISALYPDGNPEIGKQGSLLAGVFVRQPLYLGGKLKAAQELASIQAESGRYNLENVQDLASYTTTVEYIQVLYANSMIAMQEKMVEAQHKNTAYAQNLVKAEILPPYMKNWADVAEKQAQTTLQNLQLSKENSLLALKSASGMELDAELKIENTLDENFGLPVFSETGTHNGDVRVLQGKLREAEAAEKLGGTIGKPNIFAVGNVQLLRKELPIILPPWMVGVEMQWTVFDAEKKSRNLAAKALVEETSLLIDQKQKTTDLALATTRNRIISLKSQIETLDAARHETYTTTEMVRKRMENALSSVKDVNDVLQLQYDAEKLYYTSLMALQTAVATYYFLQGNPAQITQHIP